MSFRPGEIAGADRPSGTVDYRLARLALIDEYKRGDVMANDICDAHPELRRAAANLARRTTEICPICADSYVVLLTYAFGPHLPKGGYAIEDRADMDKVRRTTTDGTGYVIEVCPKCGWNHMAQSFPIEGERGP